VTVSVGPYSSASYGERGMFYGKIESIDDPLRRNRVQVRIFGYQSDEGTIPKDKLEWVGVLGHDSQMAGAGSTHMFFPGAQVVLQNLGTELLAIGSIPGFDSDKRNKGESKAGSSQNPDVPGATQGSKKNQGQASDGDGRDVVQLKREPKANTYLSAPDEKKTHEYSKGSAPFEKGIPSKFSDLASIAIDKLTQGSGIISMIRKLDGNASGAIKSALDLIQNLSKNGFGTSKDVIGAGPIGAAAQQFAKQFGAAPALDLAEIVKELVACKRIVGSCTPLNLKQLLSDGSIDRVITSLQPHLLNVDPEIVTRLSDAASNLGMTVNPQVFQSLIGQMQGDYASGIQQSLNSVTEQLNNFADMAGGAGGLIQLFGDQKNFISLASDISSLASNLGTPANSIASIGQGAIGAALKGNDILSQLISQAGPVGDVVEKLSSALNQFAGNPIALKEIMSGQINPESLLKIPLKYAQTVINNPTKMFSTGK
jgi:hypothetical protein